MKNESQKLETNVSAKRKSILQVVVICCVVGIIFLTIIIISSIAIKSINQNANLNEQLDLGDKYLSELDYEQAIIAYEAAIEIDPMSVEAYLGLADAYVAMEEYDKAINSLLSGNVVLQDNSFDEQIDLINSMRYLSNPLEVFSGEWICEEDNSLFFSFVDDEVLFNGNYGNWSTYINDETKKMEIQIEQFTSNDNVCVSTLEIDFLSNERCVVDGISIFKVFDSIDSYEKEWKIKYVEYVHENSEYSYSLININDDDIPELFYNFNGTNRGNVVVIYTEDGLVSTSLSNYIEGEGLFMFWDQQAERYNEWFYRQTDEGYEEIDKMEYDIAYAKDPLDDAQYISDSYSAYWLGGNMYDSNTIIEQIWNYNCNYSDSKEDMIACYKLLLQKYMSGYGSYTLVDSDFQAYSYSEDYPTYFLLKILIMMGIKNFFSHYQEMMRETWIQLLYLSQSKHG